MQVSSQHTSVLAIASLLLSATLWGMFWLPLRWLEHLGLHGIWITFLIYCGTLVYCIPILMYSRRDFSRQPLILLLISLVSGWCNTAFILAILHGEIVRVVLLFYLSPVWATLLARFILKEQLSGRAYLLLVIAIAGAMLMLWSPVVGYPWPQTTADWLGLSSGFAFALMNVLVHMARQVSLQMKMAFAWLGVIVVSGFSIVLLHEPLVLSSFTPVLYALLTGIVLMGGMTGLVIYGVTHMPVHRSAVILLFEVVAATGSTYLWTSERMSTHEWIGGLAVIFAAYLSARLQKNVQASGVSHA